MKFYFAIKEVTTDYYHFIDSMSTVLKIYSEYGSDPV